MVLRWGMSARLGPFASGGSGEQVFLGEQIARRRDYSEATAREVDEEVLRILQEASTRATETLEAHREALDRVANLLLEKEEITGAEVMGLLE
jgi:cell division protease FtsH